MQGAMGSFEGMTVTFPSRDFRGHKEKSHFVAPGLVSPTAYEYNLEAAARNWEQSD
jgi:hypothetical protein